MTASLDLRLVELMNSTITVVKRTGIDDYGKESLATKGTYKCYIDNTSSYMMNPQTKEITVTSTVLYVYSDDIVITDQVIFPDGSSNSIGDVETYYDEHGVIAYQVLTFR